MDKEGLDVAVLFPTRGLCVLGIDGLDPDFAAAIARAYNDWLHDFAQTAPDRMYGVTMVAPHDVSSAIEEIRRTVADYGFRGIFMRPNHVNGKKWSDPYYDPLWEECQLNLPVGFHEAGRVYLPQPMCFSSARPSRCSIPSVSVLEHARLRRYDLRRRDGTLSQVESGFFGRKLLLGSLALWRMGEYAETTGKAEYPYLTLTPLEYFQRQCYGAVECDEITAKHIPEYGLEDNMVFSTDYPHLDVKYPHAIDSFLKLPFSTQPNGNIYGTIARACTTLSEDHVFPDTGCRALLIFLRTLDDLACISKTLGPEKISARAGYGDFLELRALRPGLK